LEKAEWSHPIPQDSLRLPTINHPVSTQGSKTPTQTASPTSTYTPTPTETEVVFEAGKEINIKYLRDLVIFGSESTFEEELVDRSNYHQHLVSYFSEGNKIYGLLTMPFVEPPEGGFKAIVFNHGYITTNRLPNNGTLFRLR